MIRWLERLPVLFRNLRSSAAQYHAVEVRLAAAMIVCFGCRAPNSGLAGSDAGTTPADADAAPGSDAGSGSGSGSDVGAPRLLAPMSTSTVTQRRPTLHWVAGTGGGTPVVELCADRACTQPLAIDAPVAANGTSAQPVADLPPGWVFWRVCEGTAASATWQLWVGVASATTPVDTSSGTIFDVNGDGYPDLLIGAGGADMVHIHLGTASGLGSASVDVVSPDGTDTGFGQAAAVVGDVNGDGFADFVVGAWASGGDEEIGAAHVYLGGPIIDAAAWNGTGAARRIDLVSPGGTYGSFGETLSPAGDVDGDGYADFVVVKPGVVLAPSSAHLYRGEPAPASADWNGVTPPMRIDLQNPDGAGHAFWGVGAVGDLDGDGFADFALGSPTSESDFTTAFVHVYRGGSQMLADGWNGATAAQRIDLATPFGADDFGGDFGTTVAGVGDVDGDGYTDFVVGAPFAGLGAATLFLGNASPSAADWFAAGSPRRVDLTCPSDDDFFGFAAAEIGDVDGDGHADFAIAGAADFELTNPGAAHVYFGAAASWNGDLATQRIDLPSVGGDKTYYGRALGALGDVDGDGYADFGIGAIGGDGAAYVYFGGAAPSAATWTGTAPVARRDLADPDGLGASFGDAIQ